jgi:hypothetical protein
VSASQPVSAGLSDRFQYLERLKLSNFFLVFKFSFCVRVKRLIFFGGGSQNKCNDTECVTFTTMKYSKESFSICIYLFFCGVRYFLVVVVVLLLSAPVISFVDFFECVTCARQTSLARESSATADWHLCPSPKPGSGWRRRVAQSIIYPTQKKVNRITAVPFFPIESRKERTYLMTIWQFTFD